MKNIFSSNSKTPSPSSSSPSTSVSPFHHTFSESMMEENIEVAENLIMKWNPEQTSSYCSFTSLFGENRKEAKEFIKSVGDLRKAMHFFASENSSSKKLVHAQHLMQIAMKRLEKEFYQMLSKNRDQLDSESISGRSSSSHASDKSCRTSTSSFEDEICSEEEVENAGDSVLDVEQGSILVMSDLKSIAECMISAGYGKECVKIYKIIRKSIVDESLYKLGVEQITQNQVQKMDWELLEVKIKKWLHAVKIAMKTLFDGERILCDYVFSTSEAIRQSCFSEISRAAAVNLFTFPELVAKGKKSSEKMFRVLDLYDAIAELWPEIESIFSYESTVTVRSQALSALVRLGDAVRSILVDFEAAVQKDSSKTPVPGGGIHPLTRYVMNYISFLSDYSGVLADLVHDMPMPVHAPLPAESCLEGENSVIGARFAWLVLILLCKLDGKTELYKEVSLSYLFLANNLHYVISKVRASNLRYLLGEDWIAKHEMKVKQYSSNYERMGWSKVLATLPDPTATISRDVAKECFLSFNSAFEASYRLQSSWVVSDGKLRDEIKVSLCKKLVPAYKVFYDMYRVVLQSERNFETVVKYSPDDLGNYLSDLLYGNSISGGSSSGHSTSRGNSRSSK